VTTHQTRARAPLFTYQPHLRRRARLAPLARARAMEEEEEEEDAPLTLLSLPLLLVLHIFSLLPVDCRLRCAEVCRGWRAVLSERSLWTRLELTAESGVRVPVARNETLDSLLRCAAARAGGSLQSLQVIMNCITHTALLEVTAANASALRELRMHPGPDIWGFMSAEVEALLGAAPLLHTFAIDLFCDDMDMQAARRALRNEALFEPLRVQNLCASLRHVDEAGVMAFAADVAAHASLKALALHAARLENGAALDAVVDAALTRRLTSVSPEDCVLSPASAPALARLLGSSVLTTLECTYTHLIDGPASDVLAFALHANATLTSLTLRSVGVWHDPAAGASLMGALTGHASLRVLCVCSNSVEPPADPAAAGVSLGALVAANAPALTELSVSFCDLGDDGLRPLFEALPHNMHLRTLDVQGNFLSDAFARDVLLPAVRANTSLRSLFVGLAESYSALEALMAQRPPAD
jgi:hypothetical protein